MNIDLEHNHYYPLPDLDCIPCTGCHLNSNRVKQICTINISATICTSFLGRKTPKFKFNANYLDLIYLTAIKHPLRVPHNYLTINISNSNITEIFKPNDCSNKLEEIFQNNLSYKEFTFYTDGLVINIGTKQSSMSIK